MGGRCSINVFQIIPVTRFDEITHHFLECIFSHLTNTTNTQNLDVKPMNNDQNNYNNNNLPLLQNKVLSIINTLEMEQSDAGCNVQMLFTRLPNEDVNEIRTAIDELATAGYLYSTVDEEHYKYSGDQ